MMNERFECGDYVRLISVTEIEVMTRNHPWRGPRLVVGDRGFVSTPPDTFNSFNVRFQFCEVVCASSMVELAPLATLSVTPQGATATALRVELDKEWRTQGISGGAVMEQLADRLGLRSRTYYNANPVTELWREE